MGDGAQMSDKKIAWSASRVKTFLECEKKFYHMAVVPKGHPDRVEYNQGMPQQKGQEFHKAMELRLTKKTPLPLQWERFEVFAQMVEKFPGSLVVEYPFALDGELKPCGTREWDKVWVRAIPDVMMVGEDKLLLVDWKTGKIVDDEYQLKLCAAAAFAHYPTIQEVIAVYVFLQHDHMSNPVTYQRVDLETIWEELLETPRLIHDRLHTNFWRARPGRWCRWCDVNGAGKCDQAAESYRS